MKYSKISNFKIKNILRCFANELTSKQASVFLKLNRNTTDRYYMIFRQKIVLYQEKQIKKMRGKIEIDESYFGSKYNHDPRGRSTKRKIPVFGLLKRNGQVYTQIIKDASEYSIMPIIHRLIEKSKSNVYTDGWKTYDSLVHTGYKHHRINHSKEFVKNHNHINGIESFWSYVKRKMRKHNGVLYPFLYTRILLI